MKNKFLNINKYILQEIFSYLKLNKKLEIIKYCKSIKIKLDINKFIYQKSYFNSIISKTILDNPSILLKKNIFDKETLDKLIFEWKKETEEESDLSEKESLTLNFVLHIDDEKEKKEKFFKDLEEIFGYLCIPKPINSEELGFRSTDWEWEKWIDENKDFCVELEEERDHFKNPIKVFQEKNIWKLNYFHLTINIDLVFVDGGNYTFYDSKFVYEYFFCKTKGNKYLFKTTFKEIHNLTPDDESYTYDYSEENIRYCYTKRFDDFYFNNTELKINSFYNNEKRNIWDNFYFNNFNTVKILCDDWNDIDNKSFFRDNDLRDNLESIHLTHLEQKYNIFKKIKKNVKKWSKLKCFIADKVCDLTNSQLIKLLRNLSSLKSLFLIDISFEKKLKLNKKQKKEINELFPYFSIEINKKTSSLKLEYGKNNKSKKLKLKKIKKINN